MLEKLRLLNLKMKFSYGHNHLFIGDLCTRIHSVFYVKDILITMAEAYISLWILLLLNDLLLSRIHSGFYVKDILITMVPMVGGILVLQVLCD